MLVVKTYLAKSSISGTGLMAGELIPKGTVIWKMQHGFDVIITDDEFHKLPKITTDWILHFGYHNQSEGGYVLCMDDAKYTNHSSNPNAVPYRDSSIAARDILLGEEITEDYYNFDDLVELKLR